MTDPHCIFCKILQADLPYKLYENEHFLAILDVNPLVPGHTLLIPKKHYSMSTEFPPEVSQTYLPSVQEVISILKDNLEKVEGFTVCQSIGEAAYQTVPHGHSHIIPRWKEDPIGPMPIDRAYPVKLRKQLDEEWAAELIRKIHSHS
jgi:histidine triad (HIT) family protein